jgi:hypothetical protein
MAPKAVVPVEALPCIDISQDANSAPRCAIRSDWVQENPVPQTAVTKTARYLQIGMACQNRSVSMQADAHRRLEISRDHGTTPQEPPQSQAMDLSTSRNGTMFGFSPPDERS